MSKPIRELITNMAEISAPKPFLAHIEYFKGTTGITKQSIAKKWADLTKENQCATSLKGALTIRAANQSDKANGCPWRSTFKTSEELMPCLKHSRDTGIVNTDGSINLNYLEALMTSYCEHDSNEHRWILTQNAMNKYLKTCAERDQNLPKYGAYYVPWTSVAQAEWDAFFNTFSDCTFNGQVAVTANTFLMFYFQGETLYKRKLNLQI